MLSIHILKKSGDEHSYIPYLTKVYNRSSGLYETQTEITRISEDLKVLEVKNHLDETYSGTIYDYQDRWPISSFSNAKYTAVGCTGFEYNEADFFSSEIRCPDPNDVSSSWGSVTPHTGDKFYVLHSGAAGLEFLRSYSELEGDRAYTASVWVHKNSDSGTKLIIEVDGNEEVSVRLDELQNGEFPGLVCGEWWLMQLQLNLFEFPTSQEIRFYVRNQDGQREAFVDDFRVHPSDVALTVSVLHPRTGKLWYTLNENNIYTRYEENISQGTTTIYIETPSGEKKWSRTELNIVQ